MPVHPDPTRPGRRVLLAGDGTLIGRFLPGERDGRPLADLFELEAPPARATTAIRAELAGWRVAADGLPALGLAVTDGNPAIRLYEALGFRRVLTSMSVDM